jgi:glutaconate CoA-transferase subunit A
LKEKLMSIKEAVGLIKDGDLVTMGGHCFHRVPMELVREVVRQGRKHLKLVDLEPAIGFDLLIGAGGVKSVRFGMFGFEVLGFALNFRKAVEEGRVEAIEDT